MVGEIPIDIEGMSNDDIKIVLIWSKDCGWSNKAWPEWNKLVEKHNGKSILHPNNIPLWFENVEATANPNEINKWPIRGFPEIFIVKNNNKKSIGHPNKELDMKKAISDNL